MLGDLLCLGGAALYGVSNVGQEFVVRNFSAVEFLGMIGLFGSIINGVQLYVNAERFFRALSPEAATCVPRFSISSTFRSKSGAKNKSCDSALRCALSAVLLRHRMIRRTSFFGTPNFVRDDQEAMPTAQQCGRASLQ